MIHFGPARRFSVLRAGSLPSVGGSVGLNLVTPGTGPIVKSRATGCRFKLYTAHQTDHRPYPGQDQQAPRTLGLMPDLIDEPDPTRYGGMRRSAALFMSTVS